ncbi:TfpX/TfpZ family type IV pilin accessory protein [Aquirhabdus parva]|uniref:Type IV pilin accessory protein n=1 Tax=Aquirhabdus parva TaxID=2283318 RepID=A0A345P8A8_9GAMM|nr:TfpX/TfpZ family type IV pilin accessory protein [Aquirhabdus parva]AXI03517.1 type IV pilin accessory protein [Aquirhabdus parva]
MPPRLKAFAIHLIASILLAIFALILVFLIWYPAPLAQAVGVTHIFLLMLGIDVILGPLLTLFVYKTGKRTLKLDLTIIIVIQLAMFGYGLNTVAQGRPAWLVFNNDQFYLVRPSNIDPLISRKAAPEYRSASWFGPKWVSVQLPSEKMARRSIISETLQSGAGLFNSPTLYGPIQHDLTKIESQARDFRELEKFNSPLAIESTIKKWPKAMKWLPLWSSQKGMTVLLDGMGNVIAITDLNPWKQ